METENSNEGINEVKDPERRAQSKKLSQSNKSRAYGKGLKGNQGIL